MFQDWSLFASLTFYYKGVTTCHVIFVSSSHLLVIGGASSTNAHYALCLAFLLLNSRWQLFDWLRSHVLLYFSFSWFFKGFLYMCISDCSFSHLICLCVMTSLRDKFRSCVFISPPLCPCGFQSCITQSLSHKLSLSQQKTPLVTSRMQRLHFLRLWNMHMLLRPHLKGCGWRGDGITLSFCFWSHIFIFLTFIDCHVQECLEAIISNNECTSLVLSIAEKTDDTFRQVQIVLETCLHEHNLLQKTVEETCWLVFKSPVQSGF